jgi:hypothetical protein
MAIHTTAAMGTLHTITVAVPTTSVATPITKVTFTVIITKAAMSFLRCMVDMFNLSKTVRRVELPIAATSAFHATLMTEVYQSCLQFRLQV